LFHGGCKGNEKIGLNYSKRWKDARRESIVGKVQAE